MMYAITTVGDVAVETWDEGGRTADGEVVYGFVRIKDVAPMRLTRAQAEALQPWLQQVRIALGIASRVLVESPHAPTPREVSLRTALVALDVHDPYVE